MKNYFLQLNGHKAGPYTRQQVDRMRKEGIIDPDTKFWTEGLASWVPVAFMGRTGGVVARPTLRKEEKNYHIPYCVLCREFVSPKVAADTVGGTNYGFKKFCPNCGEEVRSQRDIDNQGSLSDEGAGCALLGILAGLGVVCYLFLKFLFQWK